MHAGHGLISFLFSSFEFLHELGAALPIGREHVVDPH